MTKPARRQPHVMGMCMGTRANRHIDKNKKRDKLLDAKGGGG